MTILHLVRHGRPLLDEGPRSAWPLDPDHLGDIDSLRDSGFLPHEAPWFTSPERRAIETAERLGHPEAAIASDLREQERSAGLIENLAAAVALALADPGQPPLPGWEPAGSVSERLISIVERLSATDRPVVLVGHGFAWTLLVAELTSTPPFFEAWRSLRMPDHCSIEDGRVVSPWSRWTSAM